MKPLVISPIRETRIIHCNNCDGDMSPNHTCDLEEIPDSSPKPPKKCDRCFSHPFSKCIQHLCRQCCGDQMCYFKIGHDTWLLSKPSYENVIQLWPKGQLWPGESTENQFLECNNCNSLLPCHNIKILLPGLACQRLLPLWEIVEACHYLAWLGFHCLAKDCLTMLSHKFLWQHWSNLSVEPSIQSLTCLQGNRKNPYKFWDHQPSK